MSAKPSERPRWIAPVLLVGGFALVFFFSNHAQNTRTPEGLSIVADDDGYRNSIADAQAASTDALKHYQDGVPLTNDEIANVRKAATWLDEANLYKPKEVGPFMLSGVAHLALGEYQKAIERLQQGLANIGDDHTPNMYAAAVSAHYGLSQCYFSLGDFRQSYLQAAAASESVPNSAAYLIARAKAALQLESDPQAKEAIAKAMKIDPNSLDFPREVKIEVALALKADPNYRPALVLAKYLTGSSSPKPK